MAERKVIKTVPLTEEQYDMLYAGLNAQEKVGKILATMMDELAALATKRSGRAWQVAEKIAGSDRVSHDLVIDWVNRCIDVLERVDDDDEH